MRPRKLEEAVHNWWRTLGLLLFLDPVHVLHNTGMLEQRFLGVVFVGQLFFFRNQVVDTVVAQVAQVQSARLHFLFAEPGDVPLGSMHCARDQMMKR